MRAIKIDSVNRTITVVDIDGNDNKAIAAQLNCQWIERVRAGERTDVWIDEEGFLTQPNPNGYFRLGHGGQMLAGHGLILDNDGAGNCTGTAVDLLAVEFAIQFVPLEEAEKDPAFHPVHTMTTLDENGAPVVTHHRVATHPPG